MSCMGTEASTVMELSPLKEAADRLCVREKSLSQSNSAESGRRAFLLDLFTPMEGRIPLKALELSYAVSQVMKFSILILILL